MRLTLLQVGEPLLREKARTLTPEEIVSRKIQELISSMLETLRDAPGVGLAAPQVGMGIQLAIIEDRQEYWSEITADDIATRERREVPFHVVVNPRIIRYGDRQVEFFEGCLSLAGFGAIVPRSRDIVVEGLDERAKSKTIHASGWYARILQHEIDHLNGTIYVDRMQSRTFTTVENHKRYTNQK